MPDHATSTSAAVQAQLDRLWALSPGADILGLDRITQLLARVGDPHLQLPPVFHVAGTNGKGSTCAFLRAALEAEGYRVHAYTSPHLVRFNERIRLAGTLIADDPLAALLSEVLDAGGDIGASFFEVTTAAAFLAFSRTPADACVIEVGLGGRLDATNVLPHPAVCGIAALGIDHQAFLGDTLLQIAGEKAGIAKPGVPLVTMHYPPQIAARVAEMAGAVDAPVLAEATAWDFRIERDHVVYREASGELTLPHPALHGAHQAANLALAAAMLRHQDALKVGHEAIAMAARTARWPARMQRLGPGPLSELLPPGSELWLDGGHNPDAGAAIARVLPSIVTTPSGPRPAAALGPRACSRTRMRRGSCSRRSCRSPTALVAVPTARPRASCPRGIWRGSARDARHNARPELRIRRMATALALIAAQAAAELGAMPPAVLILGSLYLAGEVAAQLNRRATRRRLRLTCNSGTDEPAESPRRRACDDCHRYRPPSRCLLQHPQPDCANARLCAGRLSPDGGAGAPRCGGGASASSGISVGAYRRPLTLDARVRRRSVAQPPPWPIAIAPCCCPRLTAAEQVMLRLTRQYRGRSPGACPPVARPTC